MEVLLEFTRIFDRVLRGQIVEYRTTGAVRSTEMDVSY